MNRQQRKSLAAETMQILKQGQYVGPTGACVNVSDAINRCLSGTRIFIPEHLLDLIGEDAEVGTETTVEVRNESTLEATHRLVVEQKIKGALCLNFASAMHAGGGFLEGSQAQEESLARSSGLYPSLISAPTYYEMNRTCGTALFTDHMILSPDVPVFRNDSGELLESYYEISILTAPAVNAGRVSRDEPARIEDISAVMSQRIAMVLALAASGGFRHLVLGAWGCGVFRNEPSTIAGLFASHLGCGGRYARCFDRVVFAVLDSPDGPIFKTFQRALLPEPNGV